MKLNNMENLLKEIISIDNTVRKGE
jgi:hypothetical protein